MLQPRLAQSVFARLGRASRMTRSIPWLGATTRLAQAPSGAAIGLAGIVASFALMVAMATMVTSFRQSLDVWLSAVLPADLYARAGSRGESTTTATSPRTISACWPPHPACSAPSSRALRACRSIRSARRSRCVIRPFDPARPALPLMGRRLDCSAQDPPPTWISEALLELYGVETGQRLRSRSPAPSMNSSSSASGATTRARRAPSRSRDSDYQRMTGDTTRTDVALWLAPGTRANDVIEAAARPAGCSARRPSSLQPGDIRKLTPATSSTAASPSRTGCESPRS